MPELSKKKSFSGSTETKPLREKEAKRLLKKIFGWVLVEKAKKIRKRFEFKDFAQAMKFVNKIAALAERERHHPDFFVSYDKVIVTIFTHKINGLHENDFMLAAKIEKIKK